MKKTLLFLTLITMFAAASVYAQPNIFNPNDSIVNYSSANPPATPAANTMAKWVKTTTRITWNTSKFKAYIWNGMAFRLRFPNGYNAADTTKKYPVILFMHGAGETKGIYDNEDQLFWGAQPFEAKIDAGQFNSFLLFPQVSVSSGWDYFYDQKINSVLDSLQKYCHSDPDKLILMGLSNGGFGSLSYAENFPQRTSTIISSSPAVIQLLQGAMGSIIHIPTWVASGGTDTSPGPDVMNNFVDTFRAKGGNIKYSFYPTLGHDTWETMWLDPYLIPAWTSAHKANPLIFDSISQFCANAVNVKLGLTPGFAEYQWQLNNTDIPNSNSNEIIGTQLGTYRARFRRVSGGAWSDWSLTPAVITALPASISPSITVTGIKSVVLPATDGSTTVPLELPAGYSNYEWRRVSDNALVSSVRTFVAPVGQYKAKATNCTASFSPVFNVISANGTPKPDSARNLTINRLTNTSVKLNWIDVTNPVSNETGFEIYRAATAGGPYTLVTITAANISTYTDTALAINYNFYYRIRAVNATGASGLSSEISLQPLTDKVAPSVPGNLKAIYTSRNYVDLGWTASTDNVSVTSYDIYVNGEKKYTTTKSSFTVDSLLPVTPYTFTVKALDQAGNASGASNTVSVTTTATITGLKYRYYEGQWNTVPNFDTLVAIKTGNTANIDIITPRNRSDSFGFVWEGYINIPAAGTYTFETTSNDGSQLYFNSLYNPNATPLLVNDGTHGTQTVSGDVYAPAAGRYPISMTFFDKYDAEIMQVYWTGPGITRQLIPNKAFADSLSDVVAPSTPANLRALYKGKTYVNLDWDNATDNVGVTGYDVYVNNVKMYTTVESAITADNLLPNTSYIFTVKATDVVGNNSVASNAVSVTTPATSAGLNYRYYEGQWDVVPNFNALVPIKSGTSPNTDIVTPRNRADSFGFVWEGYINIPSAGTYTFETISNDGSQLFFNSFYSPTATALVTNNGQYGTQTVSASVVIPTAGLYPIAMTFFDKYDAESMQVYWTGPGITRQLIPDKAFSDPASDVVAPSTPSNLKVLYTGKTFANLDWDNSTDNVGVTGYDVYVNNVKTYTTTESSITADKLAPNTTYSFTVKAFDLLGNNSTASSAASGTTTTTTTGLKYRYYEGQWNVVPNFNALIPIKSGTSSNTDVVTPRNRADSFGLVWEGYINIPSAGTYTFETVSNDGSQLFFNSFYSPTATALVTNSGQYGTQTVSASITIPTAGVYPIAMTFFDKYDAESMQVYWTGPGISKQLIPDAAFTDVFKAATDSVAPSAPANVKSILTTNTYVDISWDSATDNIGVTAYDVYVNNAKKATVTGNFYRLAGLTANQSNTFTIKAIDQANNMSAFSTPVTVVSVPKANGLKYTYYEGSWPLVPNFSTLTPIKMGSTPNVDIITPRNRVDSFGFVFEGYINIPTAGTYTFETVSNDGSQFYFNTLYNPAATALVTNNGQYGTQTVSASIAIAAAGTYPIALTFFDKYDAETMQIYWTGPGIAKQLIPTSAFTGSVPPDAVAPTIPANVKAILTTNTYVDLSWDSSTDNVGVTGYDVYVNGTKKTTVTGTYYRLTGLTANQSNNITIKAVDLANNMSAFSTALTVISAPKANGLKYSYYEGAWSTLPNFNTLTAVKVGSSATPDLSVRPTGVDDNFGFVWEGYINITTPGNYTFETISDDGSKFYFNTLYNPTATALVNNDGLHGATSVSGTVNVPTAGLYPISITFFERTGEQTMQVYYSGPGITRQPIPGSSLSMAADATERVVTTATNSFSPLAIVNQTEAGVAIDANVTRAFPNPFNESINVQYSNSKSVNDVSVGVYDMNGRLLQRRMFGNMSAGINTLSISLDKQMIPGMYLIKLDVDGKSVKMWKMIKERK